MAPRGASAANTAPERPPEAMDEPPPLIDEDTTNMVQVPMWTMPAMSVTPLWIWDWLPAYHFDLDGLLDDID